MTADIISGTKIAAEIRGELKVRVAGLKAKGIVPGLAMVRVGEDPASVSYVRGKSKASEELGIYSETIVLPEAATQKQLLAKIKELNRDKKFHCPGKSMRMK
jgi:methylenetetrahydrofolate dehydrogenase (NADP+)/methenyltetrahydrofolate cyclohydrolase